MLIKIIVLSILYLAVGQLFAIRIIADYEWDPKTPLKRYLLLETVAIFGPPIFVILIAIILIFSLIEVPYNIFVEDTDP
jgi:hypothetical protein